MITKQNFSAVALMTLALVAAALAPIPASAQRNFEGKFTLPCTTYWGANVLPAGEYTFKVNKLNEHVDSIQIRGTKDVRVIAMSNVAEGQQDPKSRLDIERSGGAAVATSLYLADGQRTLSFNRSKPAQEMLASNSKSEPVKVASLAILATK